MTGARCAIAGQVRDRACKFTSFAAAYEALPWGDVSHEYFTGCQHLADARFASTAGERVVVRSSQAIRGLCIGSTAHWVV